MVPPPRLRFAPPAVLSGPGWPARPQRAQKGIGDDKRENLELRCGHVGIADFCVVIGETKGVALVCQLLGPGSWISARETPPTYTMRRFGNFGRATKRSLVASPARSTISDLKNSASDLVNVKSLARAKSATTRTIPQPKSPDVCISFQRSKAGGGELINSMATEIHAEGANQMVGTAKGVDRMPEARKGRNRKARGVNPCPYHHFLVV